MADTYKVYLTKSDWAKLLKAHPELKTPISEQQPQLLLEIEADGIAPPMKTEDPPAT